MDIFKPRSSHLVFAYLCLARALHCTVPGCELLSLFAEFFISFLKNVLKLREYGCLLLVLTAVISSSSCPKRTLRRPDMVGQRFSAVSPRTAALLPLALQQDRANIPAARPKRLSHPTKHLSQVHPWWQGSCDPVSAHAKPLLQFRGGHTLLTQRG